MINKIITLFKIARKLAQSDAMEIISKIHEPPKIIKFFFYLLSFSFSNNKKINNLNEEQRLCSSIQDMGTTFKASESANFLTILNKISIFFNIKFSNQNE